MSGFRTGPEFRNWRIADRACPRGVRKACADAGLSETAEGSGADGLLQNGPIAHLSARVKQARSVLRILLRHATLRCVALNAEFAGQAHQLGLIGVPRALEQHR